jgi:hypothetical protein
MPVNTNAGTVASTGNEAEVVLTSDLSRILNRLIDIHLADHELYRGANFAGVDNHGSSGWAEMSARRQKRNKPQAGPIQWLSHETGVLPRSLHRIIHNESQYTRLTMVDQILTGLGLTHLLYDGTLKVIPNPRWSQERWLEYMEERGCV